MLLHEHGLGTRGSFELYSPAYKIRIRFYIVRFGGGLNKMYLQYSVLYLDYGRCSVNVNSLFTDYIKVFS